MEKIQMITPVFSIITPAKNAALFIHEALESVLEQTFQDYEMLVIDDNSSDETLEIVRNYQKRFKPDQLKILSAPVDHIPGPGAVRNIGLRNAAGEILAFLDADDIWIPNHLQNACSALKKYPEAIAYYAKALEFEAITREPGKEIGYAPDGINQIPFDASGWIIQDNPVPHSTGCVYRRIPQRFGGFEERLRTGQDWWFWICNAKQGLFIFNSGVDVYYRVHADSNTGGGWNVRTMLSGPVFVNVAAHSGILNPHESVPLCRMMKERTSRQLQSYLRAGKWNVIKKILNTIPTYTSYEKKIWAVISAMAMKGLLIRALRSLFVRIGMLSKEKQFDYR